MSCLAVPLKRTGFIKYDFSYEFERDCDLKVEFGQLDCLFRLSACVAY